MEKEELNSFRVHDKFFINVRPLIIKMHNLNK